MTEEQRNAPDDSEDENKWLCNGADEEQGFIGGCKSGQKTFGYHHRDGFQGARFVNVNTRAVYAF